MTVHTCNDTAYQVAAMPGECTCGGNDAGLCHYESSEPGTLLCVLPSGHAGAHDTPSYSSDGNA